jgi:uncharacterized membrane protein YbhN (UPF0104 family)
MNVEDFDALFLKHERLANGLWRWSLFLVLTLCIGEFFLKRPWLFTTKFIHVNMYVDKGTWVSQRVKGQAMSQAEGQDQC